MSVPSYILATKRLVAKVDSLPNNETDSNISNTVSFCRENGLSLENNDVSVFVSKRKLNDVLYYRCLYMLKLSSSGKVKNIDSTIQVISNFEHEFIFADKIDIITDQGVIYVDIYKLKME